MRDTSTSDLDLATFAPCADWAGTDASSHLVQFYDHEPFLLDATSRFIGIALETGGVALVIATQAHREAIAARLAARGLDLATVASRRRYVALDAVETLSRFMVDGWPDADLFADCVGGTIAAAANAHPHVRVRAFGEMVALLCEQGLGEAAVRLEELWNDLAKRQSFSLLCAYPIDAFRSGADGPAMLRVCEQHHHVIPAESYTALTNPGDRLRAITQLQQKAGALEVETAQRRKAERSLQRQQEELSDFLENAVEGLHRIGPDGRVLWANRAMARLRRRGVRRATGRGLPRRPRGLRRLLAAADARRDAL